MKGPLVSVLVAAYNAERYLGAALESLFAQDYEPLEAIVIDDGSEDGTEAVARSFPGVEYLRQENSGPAAARNNGLSRAQGEFVAILDSDDLLPPNKLSVQVGHLVEHPDVDCVLGRQEWIDPPPWLTRDVVYGELDGIPLPSAVFRKQSLDEIGGFDPTYRTGEDMDLLVRLREHGGNLTHVGRPAKDPILRSLKAKLDRERQAREEGQ